MVLLIGVVLAIFVAWRVRHLGLYVALCDSLGVLFGGVAAMAYSGKVAQLVPIDHPLKGSACMLGIFVLGWVMFRTLSRSFAGDWAVDFGRRFDTIGAMLAAAGGTMMAVGMISLLFLTTGDLLKQIAFLEEPIREAASIAVTACQSVAWFTGSDHVITLETILRMCGG
ncbi:MAG: hypothetical protein JXQ73_28585 [Phycisphaerae bacterium]|nr:hypothetical protein [Phycisphaerae bacterium]